jgi:hypothetical protein
LTSACVLIRTSHGKFEETVKAIKKIQGVDKIFSVLGRYDAVVDIKNMTLKNLGLTILRIGRMSGVVFTETLVEVQEGGE